jgi:hypothetical protein
MERSHDAIELRFALSEEMVRELLWHALAPEATVITRALNDAIRQQADLRGITLDEYDLAGVTVTGEAGVMHAELTFVPNRR